MTEEELHRTLELEDDFNIHGNSSKIFRLKLCSTCLTIEQVSSNNRSTISIDDLYGCLAMKSKENAIKCYLVLYLYVFKATNALSTTSPRRGSFSRREKVFTYRKFNDFAQNLAEMTRWTRLLKTFSFLRRQLPVEIRSKNSEKPALVLVNPAGGAGKAQRLILEHAAGIWSQAEFSHQVILTEYSGHAHQFVQTANLSDWNGIVVASGDGLVYEVINGLMSRSDWYEAIQTPIGHLPCGSGNAFVTNIIQHSGYFPEQSTENFLVQSAVMISRHDVIPFDLAIVDTCDGRRIFSFLVIEWGIVADVDCDSEKYRFLGGARFTVEALKRILQPRSYHGIIEYIPYEENVENSSTNEIRDISKLTINELHRDLLPLNEPVQSGNATGDNRWKRIEGPFAHVLVTSKQSISKEVVASAHSTLSDEFLTLQFIRSDDSSRINLAKTFSKLSDGKHLNFDFVQWIRVRAFRIIPQGTQGNIMVDGEKVSYGPIQGEILPKIGRCMGKHPIRS